MATNGSAFASTAPATATTRSMTAAKGTPGAYTVANGDYLTGIAQKLKFKGLQEKAREKIDAVAEARGLTAHELADRLGTYRAAERHASDHVCRSHG